MKKYEVLELFETWKKVQHLTLDDPQEIKEVDDVFGEIKNLINTSKDASDFERNFLLHAQESVRYKEFWKSFINLYTSYLEIIDPAIREEPKWVDEA